MGWGNEPRGTPRRHQADAVVVPVLRWEERAAVVRDAHGLPSGDLAELVVSLHFEVVPGIDGHLAGSDRVGTDDRSGAVVVVTMVVRVEDRLHRFARDLANLRRDVGSRFSIDPSVVDDQPVLALDNRAIPQEPQGAVHRPHRQVAALVRTLFLDGQPSMLQEVVGPGTFDVIRIWHDSSYGQEKTRRRIVGAIKPGAQRITSPLPGLLC